MDVVGRSAALLAVLLTAACAGADAFETCVQHSVEEGVERTAAETACREVQAPD